MGHCHPKVIETCINQMSLINTNSRFLHDEMVRLASRLSDTFQGKLDCFFFTNSGLVMKYCYIILVITIDLKPMILLFKLLKESLEILR